MIFIQLANETDAQQKMWSTKSHGMITLPIALAGVFLNLMIITIFVQKSMRTQTNNILMSISVFDMLMMLAYIPYTVYFYLISTPDPYPDQSMFWPFFLLIYNHFSVFIHACSVWVTCYLALYRLITVASCVLHSISNKTFLAQRVKTTILLIVLSVLSFMIFNILSYELVLSCKHYWYNSRLDELKVSVNNQTVCSSQSACSKESLEWNPNSQIGTLCVSVYWVEESSLASRFKSISQINFWIHAIIFRTFPCILMLVLSCLLINIMHKANLKKKALIQQGRKSESDKQSEFNRTTTMLLIIVILFFIMEFPHGILYLICGFSQKFFYEVYSYYADLLDVIVLLNSSINFFLYCFMSAEFRRKFCETFFFRKVDTQNLSDKASVKKNPNNRLLNGTTNNIKKNNRYGFLFKSLNKNSNKNQTINESLLSNNNINNKTSDLNDLKLQEITKEND